MLCMIFYFYLHVRVFNIKILINISNLFPVIFYLIYLIVMLIFVRQIFEMRKNNRNIKIEAKINGTRIIARPKYKW